MNLSQCCKAEMIFMDLCSQTEDTCSKCGEYASIEGATPRQRLFSAAPDLLNALQTILRMDVKGRQLQDLLQFSESGRDIFNIARSAIEKAKGGL